MSKQNDYFEGVIGQKAAKKRLSFRLDTHRKGAILPHALFTGSKGDGKSYMVRKYARNFLDPTDPSKAHKNFFGLNAAAIKNPTMLFEDVFTKVIDEHATIFFDEAHDLPSKVETVLLSILEPNKNNRTVYEWDGQEFKFDFRKITFLFATTEEDKVFHALRDRLETVCLSPYSLDELAEIVMLSLDGAVDLSPKLLKEMAGYIRRNARAADRLARDIVDTGYGKFQPKHWAELKDSLGIMPLGITPDEYRLLGLLKSDGDLTLGTLSSRLARPTRDGI